MSDLGSHTGPMGSQSLLWLMLCGRHLVFLLSFEQGALHFHFALRPANYAAGLAWCLRVLASETVIWPGQSTAKVLVLLRGLGD